MLPDTRVTFPRGATRGRALVLAVRPVAAAAGELGLAGGLADVVVDVTPFHPLDHSWPDQPGDTGWLTRVNGERLSVLDCLTGAVPGSVGASPEVVGTAPASPIATGADIEARRGDPEWRWLVLHRVVAVGAPGADEIVELTVDAERRAGLSRGHTACHLAALALNRATAQFWRKDPGRTDSLGAPDLDQLAITVSRIEGDASFDEYRFGRTSRKKGLEAGALLDALPQVQAAAQELVDGWLASRARVHVELPDSDDRLTARRSWQVDLPQGLATIACGGTHVDSLAECGRIALSYEVVEEGMVVRTTVTGRATP